MSLFTTEAGHLKKKKVCICLHDREKTQLNEKQEKAGELCPCSRLSLKSQSDLNANALTLRRGVLLEKKRRDNKLADGAAGDRRAAGRGRYLGPPDTNTTDGMEATERKKHIQHLHMFFPFPLIRSSERGRCPAQLHMKQCGRGAGLRQRRLFLGFP